MGFPKAYVNLKCPAENAGQFSTTILMTKKTRSDMSEEKEKPEATEDEKGHWSDAAKHRALALAAVNDVTILTTAMPEPVWARAKDNKELVSKMVISACQHVKDEAIALINAYFDAGHVVEPLPIKKALLAKKFRKEFL